jgi:hypothetical protein
MRCTVALAAVLAPAALAAPASGAVVSLDRGCYLAAQPGLPRGQNMVLNGAGFAPNGAISIDINGSPAVSTTAGPDGSVSVSRGLDAPAVRGRGFRDRVTVTASDGTNLASATVPTRKLAADFLPSRGNPRTLRVRFYVYGFGPLLTALGRGTSQPVWMHVFDPSGRRRSTARVGRTSGACGDMRTARRRILPFALVNGTWRYRFTTSTRYSRTAAPQAGVGFTVRTTFAPF